MLIHACIYLLSGFSTLLTGLYAPANGEFRTPSFDLHHAGKLWLNADVSWSGTPVTGGCDEGCAAYVMVELQDSITGDVLPGYERSRCKLMNITGLRIPLKWNSSAETTASDYFHTRRSQKVRARIFFRDTIVYALGAY